MHNKPTCSPPRSNPTLPPNAVVLQFTHCQRLRDPAAAIAVLEKIQSLKGNDPRVKLLFSTHPSPADRLDSLLQSKIDELPRPSPVLLRKRDSRFKQFRSAL